MIESLFPKSREYAEKHDGVARTAMHLLGYIVRIPQKMLAGEYYNINSQLFLANIAPKESIRQLVEEYQSFLEGQFGDLKDIISCRSIAYLLPKPATNSLGYKIGTAAFVLKIENAFGVEIETVNRLAELLGIKPTRVPHSPTFLIDPVASPLAIDVTKAEVQKFENAARKVLENKKEVAEILWQIRSNQAEQSGGKVTVEDMRQIEQKVADRPTRDHGIPSTGCGRA